MMPRSQHLTFEVAGDSYALPVAQVREIVEHAPETRIPTLPVFIRGVVNLRGTAVPVLDLRARFGRGESPLTRQSCVVVVETSDARGLLGVLVDVVTDVADLDAEDLAGRYTLIRPESLLTGEHAAALR